MRIGGIEFCLFKTEKFLYNNTLETVTKKKRRKKRTKEDLEQQLKDQIRLMILSAEHYDSGETVEGRRLATSIRVLLHDTRNSKSLLGQMGLKSIKYWSIKGHKPEILLSTYSGLTLLQKDSTDSPWRYVPAFNLIRGEPKKLQFSEWWNEIVVIDNKRRTFTRKEIVMNVANTDGGAHIDPSLDEAYWDFSREDSLGTIIINGERVPCENPELACVRQITHEIFKTLIEKRSKYFDETARNRSQ